MLHVKGHGGITEQLAGSNNSDKRAVISKKLREMDLDYNIMNERKNRKNRR
ncbi:hypothetical protein DOT_2325 [Desulfosporosinus sp. OT]|nr:hypothetical protein DOT_2325 [Desulfosporosinus sp. OT]